MGEQVHKIVWLMIITNFVTFVSSLYFLTNIFDKSRVTPFRLSVTIFVPIWIAQHGLKKKSLSLSGAIAGIIIASLTILCHWAFLFGLLGFYVTGSKVTKYKAEFKQKIAGLYFLCIERWIGLRYSIGCQKISNFYLFGIC